MLIPGKDILPYTHLACGNTYNTPFTIIFSPAAGYREMTPQFGCIGRTSAATEDIHDRVSVPACRENDKTETELFSYAVIYWVLFGSSKYLHVGGPDVSVRCLVCSCCLLHDGPGRWSSIDELEVG
jgi:hypothetical protein